MTTRQEIDFQEDIAAEPSRGGRPRDEAREQAILEAAIDLLAEVGYEAMSIEGVAVRAKSSKATIYRRWPGKAELVADAIRRRSEPILEDLPPGADASLILQVAPAVALFHQMNGEPLDVQFAEHLVDHILIPLLRP